MNPFADQFQWETGCINNVVEEAHGKKDGLFKPIPVNAVLSRINLFFMPGNEEPRQVDRAEVTGFIGQKGLLPTGIRAFDGAELWGRIVSVDAIKEDNPGISALPCLFNQQIENIAGTQAAAFLPSDRIDKSVILIFFNSLHEGFRDSHRKIEVVELPIFFFGTDEVQNIRMVHTQDAHIGATSGTSLLDLFGCRIEDAQERNRAGGNTTSGAYTGILGPQTGEGKASATTGLVDHRCILDGVKNFFNGVTNRQNKAG